jgi:hypothetical protein
MMDEIICAGIIGCDPANPEVFTVTLALLEEALMIAGAIMLVLAVILANTPYGGPRR